MRIMRMIFLIVFGIVLIIFFINAHLNRKRKRITGQKIECLDKKAGERIEKLKEIKDQYARKERFYYKSSPLVGFLLMLVLISSPVCSFIDKLKKDQVNEVREALRSLGGKPGYYDPADVISDVKGGMDEEAADGLYFSWYEECMEKGEDKKSFYVNKVEDVIKEYDKPIFEYRIKDFNDEMQTIYNKSFNEIQRMEARKVPNNHSEEEVNTGVVSPLSLDADSYIKEYELRRLCYEIAPDASMLQQLARSAEDAALSLLTVEGREAVGTEYAQNAVSEYLCLMRTENAGESKADCCYWIAKLYAERSHYVADEDEANHCRLMSYAFAKKGLDDVNKLDETNDHQQALEQLFNNMDEQIE